MQKPSTVSDRATEWSELFKAIGSAIDINGRTIDDNNIEIRSLVKCGPLKVPAGGFHVSVGGAALRTNGAVSVDYEFSGIFLGRTSKDLVPQDLN